MHAHRKSDVDFSSGSPVSFHLKSFKALDLRYELQKIMHHESNLRLRILIFILGRLFLKSKPLWLLGM